MFIEVKPMFEDEEGDIVDDEIEPEEEMDTDEEEIPFLKRDMTTGRIKGRNILGRKEISPEEMDEIFL